MSDRRLRTFLALLAGFGLAGATEASAQTTGPKEGLKNALARVQAMYDRMPAAVQNRASSGMLQAAELSRNWADVSRALSRMPGSGGIGLPRAARAGGPLIEAGVNLVGGKLSDPRTDLNYGGLAGFVQSETSTAWCSPNVVVGFNDSGSLPESFFQAFNGVSMSANNGVSFTDMGYQNFGSNFTYFLSGDPVVRCTDQNTFYYASLLIDYGPSESAISVSKSTNAGISFDDPVKAATKSLAGHFLDKEWMGVDPSNANNIYVTYTDFDSTGSICGTTGGSPIFRTAIELVRSTDGGGTWSSPLVLDNGCSPEGNQGSQVAVNATGTVYVSYNHFGTGTTGQQLRTASSTDGGGTFGAAVNVADVKRVGGFNGRLQGNFRANAFSSLAIDNSSGPRAGYVYLAWTDGSLNYPDAFIGGYNFTDILFSSSSNGGASWSVPVRVNNNPEPIPTTDPLLAGRGTDQFFPALAVDRGGVLAVCFYDRRRDVNNFQIDRECAKSVNGGTTWANSNKTPKNFKATHSQDGFVATTYMGDYDDLASDSRELQTGFRGAFADNSAGNPDVRINKP